MTDRRFALRAIFDVENPRKVGCDSFVGSNPGDGATEREIRRDDRAQHNFRHGQTPPTTTRQGRYHGRTGRFTSVGLEPEWRRDRFRPARHPRVFRVPTRIARRAEAAGVSSRRKAGSPSGNLTGATRKGCIGRVSRGACEVPCFPTVTARAVTHDGPHGRPSSPRSPRCGRTASVEERERSVARSPQRWRRQRWNGTDRSSVGTSGARGASVVRPRGETLGAEGP